MDKVLHILCSEPDDTVEQLIEAISGDTCISVVCLYDDGLSKNQVNGERLVDDIFDHQRVICWR